MKRFCLTLMGLALMCSVPALAADQEKKNMVAAFAQDEPDQAIILAPLLLRGDAAAQITAATGYLEGGLCDKANYWLDQIREDSPGEYAEINATALFNGHCRKKDEAGALELLQQCFAGSLSCGRKLLDAAEITGDKAVALRTAQRLSDYGDEKGLTELYFLSLNRQNPKTDAATAGTYLLGLLVMRAASDPELRNVIVASNETVGRALSEEQKAGLLARADAWTFDRVPDDMEEKSLSEGIYPIY